MNSWSDDVDEDVGEVVEVDGSGGAVEAAVIGPGAAKAELQPGSNFRVFLDPAGHPSCRCAD